MERIQSVNPERIEWCCADYGIAPRDLAAEVDIAPLTIERVINREGTLTFNQLDKIAKFFGRGVLFFLEDGPVVEEQVHTPAFRTLANQKPELTTKIKTLIERVERQRAIYLDLREELEDNEYPQFQPPDLPRDNVEEAAQLVRRWLGLGAQNSFDDYRRAVEAKGILVFRSNGYAGKWQIAKENPILGFALYDEVCPVIVVKKQTWETQQSFTLMHELGHLLLQKSSSIDDDRDMNSHQGHEREANAFAGQVLVPAEFLAQINDANRPDEVAAYDAWLERYRKAWGISGEVILRRLLDAGRLTQENYIAYRDWRNAAEAPQEGRGSRAWRFREPMHMFGDNYVKTVLQALSGQRISLTKASNYLDGLKLNDIRALERSYAHI